MYTALTSLSSKGQVVLPAELRRQLALSIGTKFFIMSEGRNIMLKPIAEPQEKEFFQMLDREQKWAEEVDLQESDIDEAIRTVRSRH